MNHPRMNRQSHGASRRTFLHGGSALAGAGVAALSGIPLANAAESTRTTIKDIQTMTLGGARTYVFVRVITSDGRYGIGEAYGTPSVGAAEEILSLKPQLVGKNPLEIDKLYTFLGEGAPSLAGTRTDASAHNLMRAASGIEMALWDLAGRILDTPTSVLLGGQFRDRVRVYDHSAPRDMFDKASCKEWADKVRAHPSGFTAHKVDIPRTVSIWSDSKRRNAVPDFAHDPSNRQLTTTELVRIAQGYENMREAIGWDHDIMVHCHWELDLNSALELARAVAANPPLSVRSTVRVRRWHMAQHTREVINMTAGEKLYLTEDFQEAARAFAEKRKPRTFKGR